MVKSLYTGVSGMKAHQQRMDVIGNNVANVNTVGYKTDVTTFKDSFYQTKRSPSGATSTLGGVNPRMVGYGVQVNAVEANMSQSGYTQSDKVEDLAINGNGFFQVMDGSGNIFYTRQGNFHFDDYGYLVNADGYHVLGINGNSEGQQPGTEIIRAVIPDTNANTSSATKMVNGTNVTLSVNAPSNYTDMTVSFVDSSYPYATFSDSILTIFFNRDEQYTSQQDFEDAINLALKAGGVSLPDDVMLSFAFESIPSDSEALTAHNEIAGLRFSTTTASTQFHVAYDDTTDPVTIPPAAGKIAKHAYVSFAVEDNTNKDNVKIVHTNTNAPAGSNAASATYTAGTGGGAGEWTITIYNDTVAADITNAIKEHLKTNAEAPELKLTGFVMPSGSAREKVMAAFAGTQALSGVVDSTDGAFELEATVEGEYANNYKVTFSYVEGYDNTNAVWDENNLNITICANSTIAEVNEAIKTAARGVEKKILKFNNISGLAWGDGYDGSYATKNPTTGAITAPKDKPDADVWNPGALKAFFGDHPSVNPTDGKDSFFTETAKKLGTFALENGRTGGEQSWGNVTDYTFQADGRIIAKHPIHGYIEIGRVDLATFDNNNGLQKASGTMFKETVASGPVKLQVPGTEGAGEIVSGALEMSNVNLAEEFTNMITTQRGYQANSRVITVSDTMIEELLSLKR